MALLDVQNLQTHFGTIDGVVRAPSLFSMTLALLPSMTDTQEFVVPRSIPITLLM